MLKNLLILVVKYVWCFNSLVKSLHCKRQLFLFGEEKKIGSLLISEYSNGTNGNDHDVKELYAKERAMTIVFPHSIRNSHCMANEIKDFFIGTILPLLLFWSVVSRNKYYF